MLPTAPSLPLAAIRVADDVDIEPVLDRVVHALRAAGFRLGGFVQRRVDHGAGEGTFFTLLALSDGQEAVLSSPRGSAPGERRHACTVDHDLLATFAVRTSAEIESGLDLVVLNRFGRRECAGGGCRDELAAALERGTPALCVVRESHVEGWYEFGGEFVCCLPPDPEAVLRWYDACRSDP